MARESERAEKEGEGGRRQATFALFVYRLAGSQHGVGGVTVSCQWGN